MSNTNNFDWVNWKWQKNNQYFTIFFKETLYSDDEQYNFLNINNLKLNIYYGNATIDKSEPDLIFKNDNSYVVFILITMEYLMVMKFLEIQMNNIYNKEGITIDRDQKGNYINLNKIKIIEKKKPIMKQAKSKVKIKNTFKIQNNTNKIKNETLIPNYYQPFYQQSLYNLEKTIINPKNISIIKDSTHSISKDYSINDYLRDYEQEKLEKKNKSSNIKVFKMGTCYANMTIIQSNPGLAYKLNLIKYHAYVASLYPKFYGTTPKKYPPEYYMSSYDRILKPIQEVKPLT